MKPRILLKHARMVNEGRVFEGDLRIENGRIEQIDSSLGQKPGEQIVELDGQFLLPGLIDDQVHFREPGLTHKGDLATESKAAIAGGITSFIEQPNTVPPATTLERLEAKYALASQKSLANYGFNLGASNDNLDEILRAPLGKYPGVKVFLGSSTGDLLVDDPRSVESLFERCPHLIIAHCEDEATIRANFELARETYGDEIPAAMHPAIRSEEACWLSSSRAVELARKHKSRLHVFHLSTAKETSLFDSNLPLAEKKITAEACVHHLWFDDSAYQTKGNLIKWNPAIKTAADREGLWDAVLSNRIDVIATDHAPHTLEEKSRPYAQAPSGGPLVQHALPAMFEFVRSGKISIELLVEKMCHNPAILFRIAERGFLREGYFADLVVVDPARPYTVTKDHLLSACGWSPFMGTTFKARVERSFVNGVQVYDRGRFAEGVHSMRLEHHAV